MLAYKRFGWSCLIGVSLLIGCDEKVAPPEPPVEQPHSVSDAHDHSNPAGPHGGLVMDWGNGAYHLEFQVDHDKQEATVYLLGGDAKTPAPVKSDTLQLNIEEPLLEMDLKAEPLEGEPTGLSSRFTGRHASLATVREFKGIVSGEIEGIPYFGEFDESAAGHKH